MGNNNQDMPSATLIGTLSVIHSVNSVKQLQREKTIDTDVLSAIFRS